MCSKCAHPDYYDVIVIGAGHAGCEAAHAAATMGARTLLLTSNLDTIGKMSCNPSIGGTAKGHIVREVDALGGLMGKVADRTSVQFRMLNASKGPAVRSPRSQADRMAYALDMKSCLEATPFLSIRQGTVESLLVEQNRIRGVLSVEGVCYKGTTVVLSSGTFLNGLIHIGPAQFPGGRGGEPSTSGLSTQLRALGFRVGRLKTGTPPRVHRRSIDFSACDEQAGDEGVRFSYDEPEQKMEQICCHITHTTEQTRDIIQANLHRSPLFIGSIQGRGPRYCPSIEDKIVRFPDKSRHQIFLEPEGLKTNEVYLNGLSSSLPPDVQLAILHSIPGLERAEAVRLAYAIEYDFVQSHQLYASLETKLVEGLFLAGQINGTTGYEEAAGQGMIAGINAARKAAGNTAVIFKRNESYLGVMIDDLIRFELDEPYRMFTSRAEYRLLLRQDNADLRLRPLAFELGLISQVQIERTRYKQQTIHQEIERLSELFQTIEGKTTSFGQLLCRPDWDYKKALELFPLQVSDHGLEINEQIELHLRYAGYIERQERDVEKLENLDSVSIPKDFDYGQVPGLRTEARQRLSRLTPENLGQASRTYGISPADLSILLIALR